MSPQEVIAAIEEGQRLRGWVANGYAQVEYLLGDIITKSHDMPEYQEIRQRLPHRTEKRIAYVQRILEVDGFFAQFRAEVEWIIDAFQQHHETRNLLAHGFCTAYHTPTGDFGLEFRKWHREGDADTEIRRTFRLVDLDYQRAQLVDVSERALHVALQIHDALGLVE